MSRISDINHGTISRKLLLACVMIGLVFSSGEGIRLLPFPGNEEQSPDERAYENPTGLPSQYEAAGSGNENGIFRAKFQTNLGDISNHGRLALYAGPDTDDWEIHSPSGFAHLLAEKDQPYLSAGSRAPPDPALA